MASSNAASRVQFGVMPPTPASGGTAAMTTTSARALPDKPGNVDDMHPKKEIDI